MAIVYRTAGDWGAGKGSALTSAEVDGNFYDLDQRLDDIEQNPPEADGISNITVVGTQMTIHLSSGGTLGPYTLPQANFRPSRVASITAATDGTYAPTINDQNKYLRYDSSSDVTVMLPANADVAFPIDSEITFRQVGAGQVIFDGHTDVTINAIEGYLAQTAIPGSVVTAKKVGTNEWDLIGLLAEDV